MCFSFFAFTGNPGVVHFMQWHPGLGHTGARRYECCSDPASMACTSVKFCVTCTGQLLHMKPDFLRPPWHAAAIVVVLCAVHLLNRLLQPTAMLGVQSCRFKY